MGSQSPWVCSVTCRWMCAKRQVVCKSTLTVMLPIIKYPQRTCTRFRPPASPAAYYQMWSKEVGWHEESTPRVACTYVCMHAYIYVELSYICYAFKHTTRVIVWMDAMLIREDVTIACVSLQRFILVRCTQAETRYRR